MPHIEHYEPFRRRQGYGPQVYQKKGYGPQVLTLGVRELWRMTKESPMYGFITSWKCIDGVLYFEVLIPETIGESVIKSTIMTFNVRYEKFKPIQLPCCCKHYQHGKHSLLSYEGRLALVCLLYQSHSIKLWVLEMFWKTNGHAKTCIYLTL